MPFPAEKLIGSYKYKGVLIWNSKLMLAIFWVNKIVENVTEPYM